MFRKAVILVLVVFFMILILFVGMMFLKNEKEVYSTDDVTFVIEKPTFFTVTDPTETDNGSDRQLDHSIEFFGLPLGTYTLVERTLDNGATIIFEEVDNTSWMPYTISLNINGLAEAETKTWNPEPITRVDDAVYGVDPTDNPFGTITTENLEILQGNLFVSRPLTLGNGDEVRELRHEIHDLTLEEGTLHKNFWLSPKYQTHTWMMLSSEPFFETAEAENEWIDFSLTNRQQQLNWLTPEGPLTKIPETDDLRTEMAYDYDEERMADPASAEWNKNAPSVYFETMVLNTEINLSK